MADEKKPLPPLPNYEFRRDVVAEFRRFPKGQTKLKKRAAFIRTGRFVQPEDRPPLPQDSMVRGEKPEGRFDPTLNRWIFEGSVYTCTNCAREREYGKDCFCELNPKMVRKDVQRANAEQERKVRRIERALASSKTSAEERERLLRVKEMMDVKHVAAQNAKEAKLLASTRVRGVGKGQKRPKTLREPKNIVEVAPGVMRRTGLKGLGASDGMMGFGIGSVVLVVAGVFIVYKVFQKTPSA